MTCPLLRLTDKEALVFMPRREQKINERQDERKRETNVMGRTGMGFGSCLVSIRGEKRK